LAAAAALSLGAAFGALPLLAVTGLAALAVAVLLAAPGLGLLSYPESGERAARYPAQQRANEPAARGNARGEARNVIEATIVHTEGCPFKLRRDTWASLRLGRIVREFGKPRMKLSHVESACPSSLTGEEVGGEGAGSTRETGSV
jgi:hypothetical protein